MTWEEQLFALFDDLESQADSLFHAERELELADRMRAEYQRVELDSRLMASLDREVGVSLLGVGSVRGVLQRVGPGWFLLQGPGQDWVVRTGAVLAVHGASERSVPEEAWSPIHRLGLGSALRRLAEAGERCVVHLVDGSRYEVTLARVGHDFVEAVTGEGRSSRRLLVAHAGLAAVQSPEQ
ncbi:hypothetical protein [Nocardioides pacificus]